MYYMVYASSFGGLLMLRALQKSVQRYQPQSCIVAQRRIYGVLIAIFTFTCLNGITSFREFGPRCSKDTVYPYSFMFLMIQQVINSFMVIYMASKNFWIPLEQLENFER